MIQHITGDRYFKWFLIAIGIQIVTVSLFVFRVLPQPSNQATTFFVLHHGGDEVTYFEMADGILAGKLPPSPVTLGYPLFLVPFILAFKATEPVQIIPIIAALWSIIMFPVGQWLLIRVADVWSESRLVTIVTVVLWSLLALLMYGALWVVTNPIMADSWSNYLTWAHMFTDGPSTFLTLLLFWEYSRAEDHGFNNQWAILLGVTGGVLALIRMTGTIAFVIIVGVLAWRRQWRAAVISCAAVVIVFSPQLVYNYVFWGTPFQSGYVTAHPVPPGGLFRFSYLLDGMRLVWGKIGWGTPVAGLMGVMFIVVGLQWLWKRNRTASAMVGAWIGLYGLVYGTYYYSWTGGLSRFLMPVYPALTLVCGCVIAALVDWWRAYRVGTRSGVTA